MDLLKAFSNATKDVLKIMAQLDAKMGETYTCDKNTTWGDVSGLVGLAGDKHNGNMLISFDKNSICEIVHSMLGEECVSLNDEVADAVGELTNMISSKARALLSEEGVDLDMALPMTILGSGVSFSQIGDEKAHSVQFDTDKGSFLLQVTLSDKD